MTTNETAPYQTVQEFKDDLKRMVEDIRKAIADKDQFWHRQCSRKYRFSHIAYCMLRGTEYERIESKVREGNEPDWKYINTIISSCEHLKHVPRERQEPTSAATQG